MIEKCGQCIHWEEEREYCVYNHRDFVHYDTGACAAGESLEKDNNEGSTD